MKAKNIFLIAAVLSLNFELLPLNCSAQNWLWAHSGNGSATNEGFSVSADAAGSVFVTGEFFGFPITFGATTLPNAGGGDIFLVKYDPNGNVLWAKSAGGTLDEYGWSVSADAAGNVFVTGEFSSATLTFGTFTLMNNGTSDVFIAKYDPNGNVLWAKSAGGTAADVGFGVSADAAGNAFITGQFNSAAIVFGATTLINAGLQNIFTAKYDPLGNVLWAKSGSGTIGDEGYSVSADAAGNVFVTGWFTSPTITFGASTLTNAGGSSNIFLVKYDPLGNVVWTKSAGGTSGEEGLSASADPAGNVFVTGYFSSATITFGVITLTNAGGNDVFIAKYDPTGNILWAKDAGGVNWDKGYSISADAGGNAYVTGSFSSLAITFGSTTLTPPTGSIDPMFIVKYDANGNVLCASALSSGGDDQMGVSADPFGNAYTGGDFKANPFIVGPDTLALTGTENIFVAKYTCGCNLNAAVNGNTTICSGQNTTLTASGGNNYSWSNGATTTSVVLSPTSTSTYSVFVSSGACSDTVSVTVNITSAPVASVSGNTTICSGQNETLTASGGGNYSWSNGNTNSLITVSPTSNSTYSVIVSIGNCSDTAFTSVVVNSNPIVSTSGNTTITAGSSSTLSSSGGTSYSWSNGETDSVIAVSPMITTGYCVTVSNGNCTDTACVTVFVEQTDCSHAGEFYLPNAFSPNGDGENDSLKIYYGNMLCIKTLNLVIYDRWGEKVFSATGGTASGWETLEWDGSYRGKMEDTAMFVYFMKATLISGNEIMKKGNISLMR